MDWHFYGVGIDLVGELLPLRWELRNLAMVRWDLRRIWLHMRGYCRHLIGEGRWGRRGVRPYLMCINTIDRICCKNVIAPLSWRNRAPRIYFAWYLIVG